MKAAVYARYSSENQRPESIEDQVAACRKLALQRGFNVLEEHIYSDQAKSGARKDRAGLSALIEAAQAKAFDVVLVDDLSRLARDNYLMLSIMAELHFEGVRVVSVADGLDSNDEEATLGIQIRGIFNKLQLRDLKKKTLRGQMGQKERGFFVDERSYGYRSVPVGEMRMDKKGRPRPEGYRMEIEPREAAMILRMFKAYADGQSLTAIVKTLNEEGIRGFRAAKSWSAATVTRMLGNEKYIGRWVWNRTTTRRDPRTGRRRKFDKPESEWVVQEDESLRIVPQELWNAVQKRREAMKRTWAGRQGQARLLEGSGHEREALPDPPALGNQVVRRVRRLHRPGQRQGQRLLRLHRRAEEGLRQQAPRPPKARRGEDPRRRHRAHQRCRAHPLRARACRARGREHALDASGRPPPQGG